MKKTVVRALVEDIEAEVNNGGFDQFFFNSTGDHTLETIKALEAIGANHTANIVRSAAAKFPDGIPSTNRSERQLQLEQISPDSEMFEEEDAAFLEYTDDLSGLVESYKE